MRLLPLWFQEFYNIIVNFSYLETGDILRSKCPNKLYTFNRRPGIKFLPPNIKTINVQSREECQDQCLSETGFQCRSAVFESSVSVCYLSDLTEEMAPEYKENNPDFDYMENVCITGNTKCQGINQFVSEENKELINRYVHCTYMLPIF